jgi:hypothetical protein
MAYIEGGIGKNGKGIVAPIVIDMITPRTGLGYVVVVTSLTTPALTTNKEVLFIASGVQIDFPEEKSTEPIDEVDVPNMPKYHIVVVDDIVVDIHSCSTLESIVEPKPISLDQATHNSVPYCHPRY